MSVEGIRNLLVALTIIEAVVFLGAVAWYILRINRSLRKTSTTLARVTFGVRAIEEQTAPIGSVVLRINQQLGTISTALSDLTSTAKDGSPRG